MALLSAAELARLHATYAAALADTCRVRAAVATVDAADGEAYAWPAVTATVGCAVGDGFGLAAGGDVDPLLLGPGRTLLLPRGTVVGAADRIEVATGAWAGTTWQVVGDPRPAGTYGPAVAVEIVPIEEGP